MEVMKLLQQNYKHMLEINQLTKELADTLSRGDRESAGIFLKMRDGEMEKADEIMEDSGNSRGGRSEDQRGTQSTFES